MLTFAKSRSVRRSLATALVSAAAASGCGDVMSDPGDDEQPADTTPPAIASTTPTANETGVGATTKIVVTFTESMDPATVEAAYSSADLPASQASFAWNEANTVLTINADAGLDYAEGIGTDPSAVPAKTYTISIGTGATDYAGNALEAPLALTFATKRRMVAAFGLDAALTRVSLGGSLLGPSNDMWIGDNAVDNTYRSYVTFDLSTLPSDAVVESAQYAARQLAPEGAPYNLGAVMAQHLSFPTLNNLGSVQPISLPGAYSQDATAESKAIDVTSQVADDILHRAERNSRSQYRLQIDQATNSNSTTDKAIFAKGTFEMTVVYVAD